MKNALNAVVAVLILGLFVLGGCGSQIPTGKAVAESLVENTEPADKTAGKQLIAKESKLESGEIMAFEVDGQKALLVNFDGEFLAYYATCPVHKLNVTKGDNEFVCPHSSFNFDGTAKSGTALAKNAVLEIIELEIIDGDIFVK